eukprot:CAMPEP_0168507344 /NCGR_PEP_ID=MMETSP0228-20121227/77830_1 /TAXON_ID=133427 /ORGANISM="Protoceratium reticulatum, Strain CCCM 535 (=CCMP 1889)" /LENGTH=590 /DNA_ID=CAMNT_0008524443 /DNA_START=86 /DNA_END=1858 /DNA_ORIENTATION=+
MMVAEEEGSTTPPARDYPIADAVRGEVLKDYAPDGDYSTSQLTLKRGDIVWVLERHESGWWGGHKEGDDLTGWFPRALVRPTDDDGERGLGNDPLALTARERCSPMASPRAAELALFTSDHRAVASPQTASGGRRRLTLQAGSERQQEYLAAKAECEELGRRLEAAEKELASERRRATETAEAGARSQAELALLRQERERERQLWEQDRERERQGLDQERQQWERRAREWEAERYAHDHEVRRLHEEMQRREAQWSSSKERAESAAAAPDRAASSRLEATASTIATGPAPAVTTTHHGDPAVAWWLQDNSTHSVHSAHSAASKDDGGARASSAGGRGASAGVSRRLFTPSTGAPLEGSRTPPPGPPPVAVPVAAGSVSAPTMPTISAVPTAGGSLSARHNIGGPHTVGQPPRPTPRTAATAPPWMATAPAGAATVGVPSSQFTTSSGRDDGTKIEVRALVSAFERRSNSQGAPQTHRAADPSPGRQVLYTGGAARAARAPGSSSRAGSREVSLRAAARGHDHVEPETPQHGAAEEAQAAVNFGMSPMQRQHLHHVRQGGGMAASASSPSSKAPMSVQDRIRQLNGGRFGR